ncbi:Tat pathway signal sequence domain protein [Streptomyces termitum]|nr:Tat pathway signal sequence domain protein [Streptomyces termitum]
MLRRHLGKVMAGTAMAVTGTAVAVAVTLPGAAGADDAPGDRTAARAPAGASAGSAGSGGAPDAAGAGGAAGTAPPPPATVLPAAAEGPRGTGTDPLTDAELARAEALALTPPGAAALQDAAGDRGRPQRLGTELADPEPGREDVRRAQVRFYDYARDELVVRTVNLTTGAVESTSARRGVQPSAHPEEVRAALALLLAAPLGQGVKEDYAHATGGTLTDPGRLRATGDVYRPYREKNVPEALARCGEHRCLRLVTKIPDGPWIDTRNLIVDLSARNVVRVG